MTSAVITIDGVLADQGDEESFAASKMVVEGLLLYKALTGVGPVSLVSLQRPEDQFKVDYWLKAHGLKGHDNVLVDPYVDDPGRGVPLLLEKLRREGGVVLVVEADPSRAARFLHHGASVLSLAVPSYTRSEFRPGEARTPATWDEVLSEIDAQRGIESTDSRTFDVTPIEVDEAST